MAKNRVSFLTPVGRIVKGSLYKPQDKDAEGKPLVVKRGPNAGGPRVDYYFGLAIPKGSPTERWQDTTWGRIIQQAGVSAFPAGQHQFPSFAWKVTDGDSTIPNKKMKKPCDQEGHKGHWILNFSSGFAPKICNSDGSQMLTEPDAVKCGYYVQVYGSVTDNGSDNQPGVILNHDAVSFQGYGPEIHTGIDTAAVGFGGALPVGASSTPIGQAPAAAPVATPAPAPAPEPGFLAPPPAPRMTEKATTTYEEYRKAGWSDAQLIASGLMVQ